MDLVLFDTTSACLHGEGGRTLGRHGKSKAHGPQCKQVILGLALDSEGCLLCTEIWPGNTADVTPLLAVADRLQERFGVASGRLVADRGMVSKKTMEALEEWGWGFKVDEDKIADEERCDGVWAPRVKAPLTAAEAVLKHKQLWQVERCFRG